MRRGGTLAVILFAIAAFAPSAQARLVYVRHVASAHPEVWTARDGGGHRHRLGSGTAPVISPDGERAAWQSWGRRVSVWIAPADGSGRARRVDRARTIGDVGFSPDGRLLAVTMPKHLVVYDAATRRRVAVLRGRMRGFAFAPDSQGIVYARASSDDFDARIDLFRTELEPRATERLTRDGRSLNPVWGPDGTIAYDRMRPRRDDAPVFQVWTIDPGTGARHRITRMRVPPLLSGLRPLELSADGRRLLAEFEGQDTSVGYTVDMGSGRVRALSRRLERGFVAADLSADGRTVLGTTGGPDPIGGRHHVATMPFGGGRPEILVRNAAMPDWSR